MSCSALYGKARAILFFILSVFLFSGSFAQVRQVYLDTTNSGTSNAIKKISFYSPSNGYVAAHGYNNDWVGFTSDSGHTFTKKFITVSNVDFNGYSVNLTFGFIIQGVKAFNQDTLVAYGNYGLVPAILRSTNGGNSFKLVYHNQFNSMVLNGGITDMIFPENNNIGYATDADRILKTTDKGVTWTVSKTDPNSFFDFLEAADNSNVYALSTQAHKLLKTNNGGTVWSIVTMPAGQVNHMSFISATKGWINIDDNNNAGMVFYTSNGGSSWTQKNHTDATPFSCERMEFINDSLGYATADHYKIYKTTDSGRLWQPLLKDNSFTYQNYSHIDIHWVSANQFWAGGTRDFLELSTNGGGTPIPKVAFLVDAANVLSTGIVNLVNYSKTGYQYSWYVNGVLTSNSYHTSYNHVMSSSMDTIKLIVSNGVYTDSLIKYQNFYVPPLPTPASFYPTTGSSGTFVIITGANFTTVTGVSFGGVPASSFTIVSPAKITAVVATGSTGNVTLSNAWGNFSITGFTYVPPPTAAPPTVSSFTPATGSVGTAISINGTNFDPNPANNIVYFGAVRATITAASATQLIGTVPVGASYAPISVLNTTSGLTGTSFKPFSVVFADSSYFTGTSFIGGIDINVGPLNVPKHANASDIDGDGKPDIVALVDIFSKDSIFIYRNTSTNNNFSFANPVNVGHVPYNGAGFFEICDLDGDGKKDFAFTLLGDSIVLTRNTSTPGNISFSTPLLFPTSGQSEFVVGDDLDNDGRPELVVAGYFPGKLSILRNTSSQGQISFAEKVDFATADKAIGVATGDLDGDGKKDVVSLNYGAINTTSLSIFRNTSIKGSISFSPKTDIANPTPSGYVKEIYIADYDGDDKLDLIMGSNILFNVYRNTSTLGSISFAAPVSYSIPGAAEGLSIADLSGDAKPDLLVGRSDRGLYLSKNTSAPGTASGDPTVVLNPGVPPFNPAVTATHTSDFNMDGKADILTCSVPDKHITVFKNNVGALSHFSMCELSSRSIEADLSGSSYQWQLDPGSGYGNISNGPNFMGTQTKYLSLSNIPASWNGRRFRCIVDGMYTSTYLLHVTAVGIPTVSISTPATTICPFTMVTFTATGVANGTNPVYKWQINGLSVTWQGNSPVMSTNSFQNGDKVRVIFTSQDSCFFSHSDTSNVITMTVTNAIAPFVTISGTTTVNAGTPANITANHTSAGSPAFQWQDSTHQHNWANVPGGAGSVISYTPQATGDKLRCIVTSSLSCASPASVTSNVLTFAVNSPTAVIPVNKPGIRIYPNPVSNMLFIDGLSLNEHWQWAGVSSIDGKTVLTKTLVNQSRAEIRLNMLAAGVYIVTLKNKAGEMTVVKFVKL